MNSVMKLMDGGRSKSTKFLICEDSSWSSEQDWNYSQNGGLSVFLGSRWGMFWKQDKAYLVISIKLGTGIS